MLEIEMLSRMSFLQMFGVAVSSAFNFTLFFVTISLLVLYTQRAWNRLVKSIED